MSMNKPSPPPQTHSLQPTGRPARARRHRTRGKDLLSAVLLSAVLAQAPAHAQSPNARFRGEPVTLNFVNADIEAVSRAMATILKQQILVDPRVKGNITLYSEQAITPREAYLNYLAALRGLGFTVVEVGDLFKVVPEADAKLQASTVSVGDVSRRGDQIITQIFKLNHENANNLVAVLRPLISPNNTINANPGNNSLVITDYADNLQRITKIIAAMDTPASGEVEVIPLQHAVASDIATLVQRLSEGAGGGAGGVPGVVTSGGAPTVMVDTRSNSLLVRSPSPARMASLRSLVEKLDRPTGGNAAAGNIWVVYLKNADAVKLAAVLRAAYAAGTNNTGSGAAGASALGAPAAANSGGQASPNNLSSSAGATGASPQSTAPVTASAGPSTGGFIQADPATNSLIITAPEPAYRQLRAVIDQLDSRRAQVYIESMIVKVDAQKAADIGFQWQGASINKNQSAGVFGGTNFGTGGSNIITLSAAAAGSGSNLSSVTGTIPSGFNVGLVTKVAGAYTLGALAKFMETNLDANVLSTPNLVALDNEEAKIVIGQNVPFITGSFSNTGASGGSANPFQTIERKDVGLTLRVKPQIGEDGTVRMTIYQENSNVTSNSESGLITDKSSIETIVVVDDGQIMVLGGLLKDEFSGGASKVPFLGDIPVLGGLFRSDNRSRKKSNLMVFLRPVVIRDQRSADGLTMDRYDAIRAQQREAQPGRSSVMPVNDSPMLPPLRAPGGAVVPPADGTPVPAPARPPEIKP
jgi:general secretion pathway protein D